MQLSMHVVWLHMCPIMCGGKEMVSSPPLAACQSVLGQDTDPQIAPDGCSFVVWIDVWMWTAEHRNIVVHFG